MMAYRKGDIPKVKLDIPNVPKFDLGDLTESMSNMDRLFDNIVKDIREQKDNAIAMEFTKCIGELLKKNGVVPKMTEYTRDFETENTFETRYGVSIDELDFSEHDKVLEDKIAKLESKLQRVLSQKKDHEDTIACYVEKTEELKHHIAELEQSRSKWIERAVEWQQKCEKLESGETSELPFDPLECANYLINATYERETNGIERSFAKLPDKVNEDRYTIDDLEQIAEHLLVYCKHNKESE